MAAEILRPRVAGRPQQLGREPRLRRRLHPPPRRGAELGLFEVDEAALPEVARRVQPQALLLGNLFRDQLDRYGELELVAARWRDAVGVAAGRRARRERRRSPGRRSRPRPARPDLRRRRPAARAARRCSTPPTRSTACAAARRTTTRPPTSGTSATTAARTAGTPGRRSTSPAREIELHGLDGAAFTLAAPEGAARVELAPARPLQRLQRARRRSLALTLGAPLDEVVAGLARVLGRVRALRADRDRRPAAC